MSFQTRREATYSLCNLFLSFRVKVRCPFPGICISTHSSAESPDSPPTHPSPSVVSASVLTGSASCSGCEGGGGVRVVEGGGVREMSLEGCGCMNS